MFPSVMMWSLPFSSLRDSSRFLVPSVTSCPSPLSFLPMCPLSARFCVFSRLSSSVWSPPSSVPHRPSVGGLPTLRIRPTNVLFWFTNPVSHMQVCTPPPPTCAAGGTWIGCGWGGERRRCPPRWSLVCRIVGRHHQVMARCMPTTDAWFPYWFLAVPAWSWVCRLVFCRPGKRAFVDAQLPSRFLQCPSLMQETRPPTDRKSVV